MQSGKSWSLVKYSDLTSKEVFNNNISLYICSHTRRLFVCHVTKTLVSVSLPTPNMVVKCQANSFFIRSGSGATEKKFRFRLGSSNDCRDVRAILSSFVQVIDADRNSQQDLFCSQTTFSQDSLFSQNSNSSGSLSQGPYQNFESQPNRNTTVTVFTTSLPATFYGSNSQHEVQHAHSLPSYSQNNWSSSVPMNDTTLTNRNPFTSHYLSNTSSQTNVPIVIEEADVKNQISSPIKVAKKTPSMCKDRSCQTDEEILATITDAKLDKILDALLADNMFKQFVYRIGERLEFQSRTTSNMANSQPCKESLSQKMSQKVAAPLPIHDNTTGKISEAFALADRLLNDI